MSTTTIRLGDLKDRVATAADRAGKSVHAYMLDAIGDSVLRDERRAAFVAVALERRARYEATGGGIGLDEAQAYAQALARGESPPLPVAGKGPGTGTP